MRDKKMKQARVRERQRGSKHQKERARERERGGSSLKQRDFITAIILRRQQ